MATARAFGQAAATAPIQAMDEAAATMRRCCTSTAGWLNLRSVLACDVEDVYAALEILDAHGLLERRVGKAHLVRVRERAR